MAFYEPNIKLETSRLILRPVTIADKEDLFDNLVHNKEVLKYYLWTYCENIDDFDLETKINQYQKGEFYFLAIQLKTTGEVIGIIHQCNKPNVYFPKVEIGYAIGQEHWNKGYTTEALEAFINLLKTKDVHKIIASHIKENIASGRVMQKCGMQYEYEAVEEIYYHDHYYNVCYYYLLNDK